MLKRLKSVSMLLFLMGASTGAAYAVANPGVADVKITQQTGTCTGIVKDATGEGVIGASVVVKGTTNGTITGLDGDFSLSNVKEGDIIVISFVGYATQEIKWTGKPLDVLLKDDTQLLGEVVVTALGMKREEKALGYAVTELKSEELYTNTVNPVASLQGKVAGVEISNSDGGIFGSAKIQIRGASTLGSNNQPIYVVDGVILDNSTQGRDMDGEEIDAIDYGNELKNLNPDDFETVSVLKGAAATALYGSRGLNGAVVITTKGGGKFKGFGVDVTQTLGIDHAYKQPGIQTVYGPGARPGRIGYGENGNTWIPTYYTNAKGEPSLIGASTLGWGLPYDSSVMIEDYDGRKVPYSPIKNNMLDMYQLGFNTNTNVSVRGGNEKTSFYSSVSYKKVNATTPNNTFERYAFLVKGSHKISDRVDVAASVSFANSKPRNAARAVGEYFYQGLTPLYDAKYYRDKYLSEQGGIARSGDTYANVPESSKNYWFNIDNMDYNRKETVVRPILEVNVKIADWVRFKGEGNMNYVYIREENKELGTGVAYEGGNYKLAQQTKEQTTFAGTFTFDKAIKDFNLGGFIRGEYYNNYQTAYSVETDGLIVPGQFFIGNSKRQVKASGKIEGTKRMLSAVFAFNASWKNQLYLDVTGRNDWSSALVYANKNGNYSYFYPSVSGSWLISETFKDKMPSWISFAKIRGSWAQVGNDTGAYTINSGYNVGNLQLIDGSYVYTNSFSSTAISPNLKPERKNAWEVGLDLRFLDNRINLDATYYKENTRDQIMNISTPSISGVSNQLINAGNIQNSGVEIALNTIPFRNKDWEWNLDFTFTKNNNKIIELHPDAAEYIGLRGSTGWGNMRIQSAARVGGPYGVLISDITPKRDDNGNIILKWSDSDRSAYADRSLKNEVIGDMNPDFLGSVSTGLTWKNLSFRMALDMRFGGKVAVYGNRYGTAYGWTESSLKFRDEAHGGMTWTSQYLNADGSQSGSYGVTYHDGMIPQGIFASGTQVTGIDGKTHDVSGMSYQQAYENGILEPMHAASYYNYANQWSTGVTNDGWIHDLKYIALREITVGYTFPSNIAGKIGAKRLGVSFSARNLGYLYNSLPNDVNPEGVRGNLSGEFRIRSFDPYTANYTMTINVGF